MRTTLLGRPGVVLEAWDQKLAALGERDAAAVAEGNDNVGLGPGRDRLARIDRGAIQQEARRAAFFSRRGYAQHFDHPRGCGQAGPRARLRALFPHTIGFTQAGVELGAANTRRRHGRANLHRRRIAFAQGPADRAQAPSDQTEQHALRPGVDVGLNLKNGIRTQSEPGLVPELEYGMTVRPYSQQIQLFERITPAENARQLP